MILHPCRNCGLSKNCAEKKVMLATLRPAKLRTARFKCAKQDASIHPGMVADIDFLHVAQAAEDGELDVSLDDDGIATPPEKPGQLRGIVMKRAKGDKYWVFVPRQAAGALVSHKRDFKQVHMARVFHHAIHPTGKLVPVCRHCGKPECATEVEVGEWSCRMVETGVEYCGAKEIVEAECEYTHPFKEDK